MVWVIGPLRTADNVAPPGSNARTRRNGDDVVVLVSNILVARKLRIIDILNWVVRVGSTNSPKLPLVGAVHGDLLENGMSASTGS